MTNTHTQTSTFSKTNSLLMPDTKTVSEVDEFSNLSTTAIGNLISNSKGLKEQSNCTHWMILEIIINNNNVY